MCRYTGSIDIKDMYLATNSRSAPIQDTIDNLIFKDGGVSGSDLHVIFRRYLNTGDSSRDKIIRNETMRFSYAYSLSSNDFQSYHDKTGKFTTNLLLIATNSSSGGTTTGTTNNLYNFHLIVTGIMFVIVLSLGIVFTFIPVLVKPNLLTDLILYRRFCKVSTNKYLGGMINSLADLTIGEVLIVSSYWLILAAWAVYGGISASSFPAGRAFAYVNVWNFSLILFPLSRYSVLLALFGISFERAIKFHKWLGRSTHFFVTVHFLAMLIENAMINNAAYLWSMSTINYPLLGFISWILLSILVMGTFEPIRRKLWELFYGSHIILAVLVIGLSIAHGRGWITLLPYMAASILLYLIDLLFRWVFGFGIPTKVVGISYNEDCSVTTVTFQKRFLTFLNIGGKPGKGSFIFVYLPSVSPFEYHPFTVSSYKELDKKGTYEFTCHVKNHHGKGYGNKLANLAKSNPDVSRLFARVEGAFGNLSIPIQHYQTVILISGGIGITFVHSLLDGLVQRGDDKSKKIHLWWSFRHPSMLDLFPTIKNNSSIEKELFLTGKDTEMGSHSHSDIKMSRMDVKQLLEKVKSNTNDSYVGVFVCGPTQLISTVQNAIFDVNGGGTRFHLHKEVFEF